MLNLSLKTIQNNKYKLNTDIIENFVYQNYYNKNVKLGLG